MALIRRYIKKENDKLILNLQKLNTIPSNAISVQNAFQKITTYPAYKIEIQTDVDSKVFKRQIASLHNLYSNKKNGLKWAWQLLIGWDWPIKPLINVYKACSTKAKALLDNTKYYAAQQSVLDQLYDIQNEILIVSGPAGIRKTLMLQVAI